MREKVPFVEGPLQQERLGRHWFFITRGQSVVEQYERHCVDCSCSCLRTVQYCLGTTVVRRPTTVSPSASLRISLMIMVVSGSEEYMPFCTVLNACIHTWDTFCALQILILILIRLCVFGYCNNNNNNNHRDSILVIIVTPLPII